MLSFNSLRNSKNVIISIGFILFLIFPCEIDGANILFFIGAIASHSHKVAVDPLANKLAENGHKVTFFTPLKVNPKENHPSVKYFTPPSLKEFHNAFLGVYGVEGLKARVAEKYTNELLKDTVLLDTGYINCQILLSSPELQPWMESQKFDLVFIDTVCNECAFGLAHYFKAKKILFGPFSSQIMWDIQIFGVPNENSWVPTIDLMYQGEEMSFFDRLRNAYGNIFWVRKYLSHHLPRSDQLIRDTLGDKVKDMPPLEETIKSTDLMMLNMHYSDQFAKPFPPFIIPVGGMHLKESNGSLPADMEKFISKGGDAGFIYVSFGSIVKITTCPPELIQVFFDAFKATKLRFLWKWEGELPKNAPENIFFHPWFPQQDVLAHPKIRGYIMQGGQISIQQAIFNAVPLIMFPVNGDQDYNAKRMRLAGNGIELEFSGLTSTELKDAVEKLVSEPSYKAKSKLLSTATRDRIMSPLDTAFWWTEFVLRNDDTSFLKPHSMNQSWIVTWNVDLWVFLFAVIATILYIAQRVVCTVRNILKGNSAPKPKPKLS